MSVFTRPPTEQAVPRGGRRRASVASLLLVAVTVATSCSGAGDEAASGAPTGTTPVPDGTSATSTVADGAPTPSPGGVVDGLSIDADAVAPFGRLTVTGVQVTVGSGDSGAPIVTTEPDVSELELFMYVPGLDAIPVDVFVVDDRLEAAIGMHPLAPFDGGRVELQFAAGEHRGPALPVALGALEPAPGAWDRAVSTVVDELTRRAAAAGTTLDQLAAADATTLDAELRILKLVAGLVDDGSEHDVESLADELDTEARALLDAIVAQLDPLTAIPPEGPRTAGGSGIRGFASRSRTPAAADSSSSGSAPPDTTLPPRSDCTYFPLDIPDGATLSTMIQKGVSSRMGPSTAKLTGDVAALNAGVGKVNDAFGVAGGPLGAAAGTASTATAALDALYTGLNLWSAIDAGRYPSSLVSMTVRLSTTEFNEDFVRDGAVQSVEVTAASTGFDMSSAGAAATSITNLVVGGTASSVTKSGLGLKGRVGDAYGTGFDKVRETATGRALGNAAEALTDWCDRTWDVDITGPQFVQLRAALGNLGVDDPGLGYRPVRVGDDFLTVSARPGAFAGESVYAQTPIRIHELQVVASPTREEITDPGEVVQIEASAEYADTPTLDWDPGAGTWGDGAGRETPTGATRPLVTPTDPDAYPFVVTVTSTSETGLRQGKSRSEPRDAEVWIELQDFVVVPDPGSVLVGRTLQFTALDRDGVEIDVDWSATGGSIDADGRYLAGDRPGTYAVTATSRTDPSRSVTVVVVVGEATCLVGEWELRSQEYLEQLFAAAGDGSVTGADFRGGSYRVSMSEDGSYTSVRQDWSWSVATSQGGLVTTMNGTTTGSWSATADTLAVDEAANSVEVSMGILVGDRVTPLPFGDSRSVTVGAMAASGPYRCDGDVLTVTAGGVTATFDRVR